MNPRTYPKHTSPQCSDCQSTSHARPARCRHVTHRPQRPDEGNWRGGRASNQDEGVNLLAYRSILPLVPADGPFDGVGEITFEDGAAFQHVTVSDGWQAAIANVANFTTPDQNVVVVSVEQDHLQTPTDRATTTE